MSNKANFATSTVASAPSPATSGTSLDVASGHGTRFPSVNFYAVLHPSGEIPTLDNAEVVLVTAVSTDTFTITRAQKGTSAKSVAVGWRISNPILTDDFLDPANNLSDLTSASTARTNLGLGSIATQAASNVSITGGSITGITDLAVADGGTGASTASGARTNLGLVIGTDVQAQDAELAAIAGLTSAADRLPYFTGLGTASLATFTSAARTVLDDASVSAMVDTLGGAASTGSGGLVRATSPTLVTPILGTPTSVTLTNGTGLPVSGITSSTTTALGVGSLEVGHASDTTISRASAGRIAVEGVNVVTTSSTDTLTNKTLTTPTIAQINNSSAPGVKLQLRTQTDNSNTLADATTAGVFLQMGWGQMTGNNTGAVTESVTFPTAFTTVYGVVCSLTAAIGTTPASDITGLTTNYASAGTGYTASAGSITNSGFTAALTRSSSTFSSGAYYGYAWLAWGV